MNYPDFYETAWLLYAGASTALFFLWWWVVSPLKPQLKTFFLLFYAVLAWTPVALNAQDGIWSPAIAVVILGGWMDGEVVLMRGLTPILAATLVAAVILTVQAFFIRAKRD